MSITCLDNPEVMVVGGTPIVVGVETKVTVASEDDWLDGMPDDVEVDANVVDGDRVVVTS